MESVKMVKRSVELEIGKGKGKWFCVKVGGKKFIMREVSKFYWEGGEDEVEDVFGKVVVVEK